MIQTLLANQYTVAVVIPIILLLTGAFAKKLVRGSNWEIRDFFLGVEFTLAAMTSGLVYFFDLAKDIAKQATNEITTQVNTASVVQNKLTIATAFVAVTFFLLLWVLSTHQDWERKTDDSKGQFWRLCIMSNLMGSGLMAAFILIVKGVR
jgi:hypothetical protein